MKKKIKILILSLLTTNLFAGNTISFVEVKQILVKNQSLWKYVNENFYFSEVGSASKFNRQWKYLVGNRSAPYFFSVLNKKDKKEFTISIDCDKLYLDKTGKRIKEIDGKYPSNIFERAEEIKEYPRSITIYFNEKNKKKKKLSKKELKKLE